MKKSLMIALGTACLSAGMAFGEPASPPRPTVRQASTANPDARLRNITIVAIEGKITPDVIRVHRGDLVRLTFKAKDGTYGVKIPAFNVKGKATPERPVYVEFAATSEGEYDIRCTKLWGFKHWSENGKIVVE